MHSFYGNFRPIIMLLFLVYIYEVSYFYQSWGNICITSRPDTGRVYPIQWGLWRKLLPCMKYLDNWAFHFLLSWTADTSLYTFLLISQCLLNKCVWGPFFFCFFLERWCWYISFLLCLQYVLGLVVSSNLICLLQTFLEMVDLSLYKSLRVVKRGFMNIRYRQFT